MLAGWGMGREAAGVKDTKKGKGQAREWAHLCRSNQHIQARQMSWYSIRKSEGSRKLRKKIWGELERWSLSPEISRVATWKRPF